MNPSDNELTARHDAHRIRGEIRRHGEVLRRPEGRPPAELIRAMAYLYAAYGLGSATAARELEAVRSPRTPTPSREVALGIARGLHGTAERSLRG